MPRLAPLLALFLACSLWSAPSHAQEGVDAATYPVCVGLGGDALTLAAWTAEQIAEHEARAGQPVLRAHPETGTCEDPSGLPVVPNAASFFSYVCAQDAAGGWYGPVWAADIYLLGGEVPPDPATGGCPLPRSPAVPPLTATEQAAATAVYLSQLEATGEFDTLYDWLHPDAQAVVPRTAVVGWYAAAWAPRGADPITVIRVRFVDWTWSVTGETYAGTAEVAFQQRFADGSVVADVVRLVKIDTGAWCWFFGRDPAFVAEQIARYGDAPSP